MTIKRKEEKEKVEKEKLRLYIYCYYSKISNLETRNFLWH